MEPIIVKNLFDESTHSSIMRFLDDVTPMLPLATDTENFVRTYAHNVPFFVHIHNQLKDFASEQFGEPLKPSYVFLSMYKDGGYCPLHIDRPQCYRTIDYLIRQENQNPWPIFIGPMMSDEEREKILVEYPNTEDYRNELISVNEWSEILLNPNDAVLYSGTHSLHYRNHIEYGTADLLFFHFVREDFDGPLS